MQLLARSTLYATLLAALPVWAGQTMLAPIHVQADKDDFAARQASTSTKLVFGREELDRMNELTLGDYLRWVPSVTFTDPPGNPKDVRGRGMAIPIYTRIILI